MGTARQEARAVVSRLPDALLAGLVTAVVGMMIVPLPTALLDLLIAANITGALLMLLVSLYARDALAFAAMPTVLLVSTLYRLALNVSSTRLILLQADAGEIIAAFGNFVVRGDYIVGGVVFLVLTLVQFLVVARGAERVAEVGARFTLDAMPGKQLAIDADLRSGTIGPEQARQRRRELERESQFYGAMDGAMKFVKGDAIAGLAITAINLVAGIGIGTGVRDLGLVASLQTYGLLTIGDGLVSQLPALLASTSAGVLVTRVAAPEVDTSLSRQIGGQLFGDRRVLRVAGLFLLALALVPGLPMVPFLGLAGVTLFGGFWPTGGHGEQARDAHAQGAPTSFPRPPTALALQLGPDLPESDRSALQALTQELHGPLRDLGVPASPCAVTSGTGTQARLLVRDRPVATRRADEPPAEFIAGARIAVMAHADRLLDLQTVQRLVDGLEAREPAVVRQSLPEPVSLTTLQSVLRGLIAEGVSVRDLGLVLESTATAVRRLGSPGPAALLAEVRRALGPSIAHALAPEGVLRVHALSPLIEDALREHLVGEGDRQHLALPPDLANDIVSAVRTGVSPGAALIADAGLRPHLRGLIAFDLPGVAVVAYPELPAELTVEAGPPIDL